MQLLTILMLKCLISCPRLYYRLCFQATCNFFSQTSRLRAPPNIAMPARGKCSAVAYKIPVVCSPAYFQDKIVRTEGKLEEQTAVLRTGVSHVFSSDYVSPALAVTRALYSRPCASHRCTVKTAHNCTAAAIVYSDSQRKAGTAMATDLLCQYIDAPPC